MRRVLVDHARQRAAAKRAGGWCRVSLDEDLGAPARELDLVELEDALGELAALDPEKVRLVELRFFGGPEPRGYGRVPRGFPLHRHEGVADDARVALPAARPGKYRRDARQDGSNRPEGAGMTPDQ